MESFTESNVEILALTSKNDTSGQNRSTCRGNLVIDVSGTVPNLRQNATVIAGKTLSGELNDTSDITKKYDVKILNTSLPQFTTSSTAQGGGGSFKNRKPIGEVGCCESGIAERSH